VGRDGGHDTVLGEGAGIEQMREEGGKGAGEEVCNVSKRGGGREAPRCI